LSPSSPSLAAFSSSCSAPLGSRNFISPSSSCCCCAGWSYFTCSWSFSLGSIACCSDILC
jgi:hypothetical protein